MLESAALTRTGVSRLYCCFTRVGRSLFAGPNHLSFHLHELNGAKSEIIVFAIPIPLPISGFRLRPSF